MGQHCGGCRFAVHAGDADTMAIAAHQKGKEACAVNERNAVFFCCGIFRIVLPDRGVVNNSVTAADVFGIMLRINGNAGLCQHHCICRYCAVGAGDMIPLFLCDHGKCTHGDTADPDEKQGASRWKKLFEFLYRMHKYTIAIVLHRSFLLLDNFGHE